MSIKIFNTKNGQKVPLEPMEPNHVKLYVCGITAYDYCHIGHARSALVFDMIVKYLRYRGYRVTYVRNFTDIDDKIINRANEQQIPPEELSEKFIEAFNEDMEALGAQTPDIEPKATEHVQEIIALIQSLIDKGYAYQSGHDVFYSVEKFNNYGRLSGRNLEEMRAGARISINESKINPMDFALWKSSKPGEPTWDSPWGPGRPGWHIECSAMSKKYLGDSFDIHGGGKDLIFPHHENEIAQSEGATGAPFVHIWIHHGFVTIKEEKMSKSLGNFLTIREVLDNYAPEVLRLFVFSTQYRNPLDYSDPAMKDASAALDRLYTCLAEIQGLAASGDSAGPSVASKKEAQKIDTLADRFKKSMDNDFNTAQGLGHIFDTVKTLNRIKQFLPPSPSQSDIALLRKGADIIKELADIMGLLKEDPLSYIERKEKEILQSLDIDKSTIEQLIQEREIARQQKDWAKADAIRDRLLSQHIDLKDSPTGTTWKVKTTE